VGRRRGDRPGETRDNLGCQQPRIAIDREAPARFIEPVARGGTRGAPERIHFRDGPNQIAGVQIDFGAGHARLDIVTWNVADAANGHEVCEIGP
jgi:hypothetical protein